jgi:hypothetical protein
MGMGDVQKSVALLLLAPQGSPSYDHSWTRKHAENKQWAGDCPMDASPLPAKRCHEELHKHKATKNPSGKKGRTEYFVSAIPPPKRRPGNQ